MAKSSMRWAAGIAVCAVGLVAGTALAQRGSAVGDRPDCVVADGQAVYTGFGYRHSVHVVNQCTFAVDCHVFTDVNPEVQDVHVAPGASTDVATYLSSPARVFIAHVDCPHEDLGARLRRTPSE